MLVAGAGCRVPPSPAPPLGRCFSWYCDSHDYRCNTIYTLSKLGCLTSLFTLNPWIFRNLFVSLHCIRIDGNAEVRPLNVNADAQANGGNDGEILVTAFLFNIIAHG